jgi:hypothetical protein
MRTDGFPMLELLRQDPARARPSRVAAPRPGTNARSREERVIVCARCGHRVTTDGERLEVEGRHEHTFLNPAGIVYRIACFRDAPGCTLAGGESSYWSWFPGFSWTIAVCEACGTHLGWAFRRTDEGFYGLIVKRLGEAPEPSLEPPSV